MSIAKRSVSKNEICLTIPSVRTQVVNVRVVNILGESKISIWEQMQLGENSIMINTADLTKGSYRILVDYNSDNSIEDKLFIY